MSLRVTSRIVRWILLAAVAMAPTAVFAEQEAVSQGSSGPDQDSLVAVLGETEAPAEVQPEETATAQPEDAASEAEEGPKVISGMSILGNQEAPTSLVIVPWKSSQLGDSVGISTTLDDSREPVDREVFMRALSYYQIRSGTEP